MKTKNCWWKPKFVDENLSFRDLISHVPWTHEKKCQPFLCIVDRGVPIQNTEYRVVFRFSSKCGAGPVPDVHVWKVYQILIFHTTRASDFFWPFWDGFSWFSCPETRIEIDAFFQGGTVSKANGVVVDWSIADLQSLASGPMTAEKQPTGLIIWLLKGNQYSKPTARCLRKERPVDYYFWPKHSIFYRSWPWHVLLFLAPVYFIALGPAIP